MRIQNLFDAPTRRADVETLIAEHFPKGHSTPSSFPVASEFAPLLQTANSKNVYFIEEDGMIIATLSWKAFDVSSKEGTLRVAALGLVLTHPEHRGKGFSTALMKHAETIALDEGCSLMFLWSDLIDHYLHRGYLLIGGELNISIDANVAPAPASNSAKLKNFDVESALKLYQSMKLGPRRSKWIYNYFLSLPSVYALQTEKAYLLAGKARDLNNVIHELVGDPSDYSFLVASLLAQIATQDSKLQINLQVPTAHPHANEIQKLWGVTQQGPWVFAKILNYAQIMSFLSHSLKPYGLKIDSQQGKWRLIKGSSLQNSAVLFESGDAGHMLQIFWSPWPIQQLEGLPENVKSALSAWQVPSIYFWGMDSV